MREIVLRNRKRVGVGLYKIYACVNYCMHLLEI